MELEVLVALCALLSLNVYWARRGRKRQAGFIIPTIVALVILSLLIYYILTGW